MVRYSAYLFRRLSHENFAISSKVLSSIVCLLFCLLFCILFYKLLRKRVVEASVKNHYGLTPQAAKSGVTTKR